LLTLNFKVFYISGCIFAGLKMIYEIYFIDEEDEEWQKIKEMLLPYPKKLQALILLITTAFVIAGSWFLEIFFLTTKLIKKFNNKDDNDETET